MVFLSLFSLFFTGWSATNTYWSIPAEASTWSGVTRLTFTLTLSTRFSLFCTSCSSSSSTVSGRLAQVWIVERLSHQKLMQLVASCFSDLVVINSDWFLGYFVGNTLWLIAIGYYLYITFLGYNGESFTLNWCTRVFKLIFFYLIYQIL